MIVAAGHGTRFGRPKQFIELAGMPMVGWSMRTLAAMAEVEEIVVATEPESLEPMRALLAELAAKHTNRVVRGGATRQQSVYEGVRAVSDACDAVLVHDGARPLVTAEDVRAGMSEVRPGRASLLAAPVVDTIKRVETASRRVEATLDRARLWAAQTPQFAMLPESARSARTRFARGSRSDRRRGVARARRHRGRRRCRDERELQSNAAGRRRTRRRDPASMMRVGHGFDAHRLAEGRPLVLGGVRIPFERGPLGHSDGDVLAHALADALLGAAALGDLGARFPDTDARWKDADSMELLAQCAAAVRDAGYSIGNVDATIVVERPKLAPFIERIRANVAQRLGLPAGAVSVKAKSSEGMGYTGDGTGLAVYAVALLASQ